MTAVNAPTPAPAVAAAPSFRRGTRRGDVVSTALVVVVVAVLAYMPYLQGPSTTYRLTGLFVLVILASMWNLLAGFGGMISVGLQAFVGIGSYTVIFATDHGIDPYLAVVVAVLVELPPPALVPLVPLPQPTPADVRAAIPVNNPAQRMDNLFATFTSSKV